jgi:hypothetical protein
MMLDRSWWLTGWPQLDGSAHQPMNAAAAKGTAAKPATWLARFLFRLPASPTSSATEAPKRSKLQPAHGEPVWRRPQDKHLPQRGYVFARKIAANGDCSEARLAANNLRGSGIIHALSKSIVYARWSPPSQTVTP